MMLKNSNHLYAIRKSDEQLVFIDDVPNGKKCGCICSKCKDSLVAKNGGKKNVHHFSHSVDSNCKGESLSHLKAKEIIMRKKYLWLPTVNENQKVKFDYVEDEILIGDSNYRADLICKTGNKSIIVEIVVTHDLDSDKSLFLKSHNVNTLIIDLSRSLRIEEYNNLPDKFSDIVLKTAHRYWFCNEKLQKLVEEKLQRERGKFDKLLKVQLQNKQKKSNAQYRKMNNSLKNLHNTLDEINRGNKEILYGTVCYADCRKFGGWHNVLCVKSNCLPSSFDNLAFIKYDQYCIYKNHVGEKVGFKIYHYVSKAYEFEKVIMPFCKIVWNKKIQDKKDEEERAFKIEKENALPNFKKENKERIKELIEVSKNNPGYTENLVDDFVNKNYTFGKDIKIIEKINWLIMNGGLCGE